MSNRRGNAYGLTALSPIKPGIVDESETYGRKNSGQSHVSALRELLEGFKLHEDSPLAKVPNTYLARLYVLNDVFYQGKPATHEHLKSKYLVFESNLHGDLDAYLEGMWHTMLQHVNVIWSHCIGFEEVKDAKGFVEYIKKCQVNTTFFFVGSNDISQEEQLKSLYLKQEFSEFVSNNQGKSASELQSAFQEFMAKTQPTNLQQPTWRAGASSLENAVIDHSEGPK
ncbi:MAG: hypothetical protein ACRBHB_01460 [Arenicella sp.]